MLLLALLTACGAAPDDSGDPPDTSVGDTADTTVDDTAVDDTGDSGTSAGLLAPGFEASLDTFGGCSDTWLQAWDGDGDVGLEVYRSGVLQAAIDSGAAVDETLEIGVDDVTIAVEVADPVAINYCTDALSQRNVMAHYDATAGTVHLVVEPAVGEGPGYATAELSDLVLDDGDGHTVDLPAFTLADVAVIRAWGG